MVDGVLAITADFLLQASALGSGQLSVAAGALGMFLTQSAMNAGRLIAAQPGLTLPDPIVSILWGVMVFGERVRGGWFIALAALSGLVMAAAVVPLARSPLLAGESARAEEGGRAGDEPGKSRRRPGTARGQEF